MIDSSAVISGVIGGVGILIGYLGGRRKSNAEADVTLGAGWQKLVEQLQAEIIDLRGRVTAMETELATAKTGRADLDVQVRDLKGELARTSRELEAERAESARLRSEIAVLRRQVELLEDKTRDAIEGHVP